MARITVATCQFPVSDDVAANERWIVRHLRAATAQGATVVHLPEAALSGYPGSDRASFADLDWDELRATTERILAAAGELGTWVVLGSAHPLSDGRKPHNCLYVVDDRGALVDRYDKRFCSGDADGRSGDLAHYSPGDHTVTWDLGGVRCGALICYDFRFPELYRDLVREGVQLVFHSFHAANASPARLAEIGAAIGPALAPLNAAAATHTYPAITMPASMVAAAAANHVWISAANSSARESLWPAFAVRADGVTVGRLRRNVAGILLTEVDTEADLYDSTAAWRPGVLAGARHSGRVEPDPRSDDRTSL